MDELEIYWNYSKVVGYYDDANGMQLPIYYKEGTADADVTLPTGDAAKALAEGTLVRLSGGTVKTYHRADDEWDTLIELSGEGA